MGSFGGAGHTKGVAVGFGVGVAVGLGVGVAVGLGVGVAVGLGVGVAVGLGVGVAVGLGVGVAVGLAVGVAVGFAVGVAVGFAVGVAVGFAVGVAVGLAVGVAVGLAVGVAVALGLGLGLGVAALIEMPTGTLAPASSELMKPTFVFPFFTTGVTVNVAEPFVMMATAGDTVATVESADPANTIVGRLTETVNVCDVGAANCSDGATTLSDVSQDSVPRAIATASALERPRTFASGAEPRVVLCEASREL